MSIEEGKYFISKDNSQNLMLHESDEDVVAFVLRVNSGGDGPKYQWKLTKCSNGNYHIQNEGFDGVYYLAPVEKEADAPIEGKREAFEWRMQPAGEPHQYHIVVPGGPIDGEELVADVSLVGLPPRRVALTPMDVHDIHQTWLMTKLDV